jgi:hypothetical protein
MDDGGSIAVLAILGIFIAPVVAIIVWRTLAHRERMEMIRHGFVPHQKWHGGTAWQPTGAVPPPPPPGQAVNVDFYGPDRSLRKGIMLSLIGLAVFIGLSFIGYDGGRYTPGPWLLGGLVPMFVGIAQIIIALLSGARLAPPPMRGTFAPPPPPPGAGPYAGPETRIYGPEPTVHTGYEELKRPAPPPDYR